MTSQFIPAIALGLAVAIFFGYVAPTYSGFITETQTSIDRQQAAIDAVALFIKKEEELTQAKNAISEGDLARLETLLPSSVDPIRVILDISTLAKRSGIQLASINATAAPSTVPAEGSASPLVEAIDLAVSASGTYQALHTFMTSIERSARLLDITNMTVSGADTGVYQYSITMRFYLLK